MLVSDKNSQWLSKFANITRQDFVNSMSTAETDMKLKSVATPNVIKRNVKKDTLALVGFISYMTFASLEIIVLISIKKEKTKL